MEPGGTTRVMVDDVPLTKRCAVDSAGCERGGVFRTLEASEDPNGANAQRMIPKAAGAEAKESCSGLLLLLL